MLPRDRIVVGWVAGLGLVTALSAVVDRAWLQAVARKEGPVEWASALILALAAVAWLLRARTTRPRSVAVLVALGCVVVLGEELDWGRTLQWPTLAARLESFVGQPNLHNAGGGSSYLLFALPWLALYVAAAKGWGVAAGVPPRGDAAAAAGVACAALASVTLPATAEAIADEVTEMALYGLLLLGAWPRREPRAGNSAREQLEGDEAAGAARALPGPVDGADAGLA